MGTPEFAVATLGSLLMNSFNVVGVVTAPDKPAGRGRKLKKSAVKEFAEYSSIPVMQPENLKDPDFTKKLQDLNADVFVVVAFRMLPETVWKIPPIGTINLHASLLPHYRGAAPINRAIINGEAITGVTTFLIDDKIDSGLILLKEEIPIFPFENAGNLHDRLMKLGARLVIRTLNAFIENKMKPVPQSQLLKPGEIPKLAPKIKPDDCVINWDKDPIEIHNLIRGLSPYPCARSFFKNDVNKLTFKIYESHPENEQESHSAGQIISDGKYFLKIACKRGSINIISIQLEGKKRMDIVEFLRGFKISDYQINSN